MGAFTTKISRKAQKELDKLDSKMYDRIMKAIELIENDPVPAQSYDVIKLGGSDAEYRIRISSYRILYTVYWDTKHIDVTKIDRRSDNTYN